MIERCDVRPHWWSACRCVCEVVAESKSESDVPGNTRNDVRVIDDPGCDTKATKRRSGEEDRLSKKENAG
jgi:hypothetical protein